MKQFNNREPKKKSKRQFRAKFVQVPMHWIDALGRAKCTGSTYQLAFAILIEDFKRTHLKGGCGEIVLSQAVTSLSRVTRVRAAEALVELRLIKIHKGTGQAIRVIKFF